MNDLAKHDLEGVVEYLLETEREDFGRMLCENPSAFPGLTEKEVEELSDIAPGERCEELIVKAATCEDNRHVYACAYRLWKEFLRASKVKDCYPDGECPDCGEPIPSDADYGDECGNCGHVFYNTGIKTVTCSLCGEETPANTAHLHQGKWIGDDCCWTEQLRSSE